MVSEMLPLVAVSVAAVTDIFSRRIPNWLCLAAFSAGLLLHLVRDGAPGVPVLHSASETLALVVRMEAVRAQR